MTADIVTLADHRSENEQHTLGFLIAVSVLAERQTAEEAGGVEPDPLLEILIKTARMFRDRQIAMAGAKS